MLTMALYPMEKMSTAFSQRKAVGIALLLTVVSLSACGDKEKNTGKVLARVDGKPITAFQLETELKYAGGAKGMEQHPPVRGQALEALIDRQILLDEAMRNKLDRNPKLIQVVNRFKTQAIVQAYLESIEANRVKPSRAEVDAYFKAHPELFANRKIFNIQQLSIVDRDLSLPLKTMMDSSRSLDQIESWLKKHAIAYDKGKLSYTSGELPPDVAERLQKLRHNRFFILKDGQRDRLCMLTEWKDSPVTEEIAYPQIERYLLNKKMQEVSAAEIARLRSAAKIEYVEKPAALIVENTSTLVMTLPGQPKTTAANAPAVHADRHFVQDKSIVAITK